MSAGTRRAPRRGRSRSVALVGVVVAAATAVLLLLLLLFAGGGTGREAPPQTGSTLEATWVDRDGDGALERGSGEALRDRVDLGPASGPGRTIATFAQITDAHVRDEESPGRLPVLDRLGPPFVDSFRPQEALTPHVLAGTVASLNRLRPQAVAVTGDLVDSAQGNELDQALAVLGGGRVDPDSGRRGYDGPQAAANPDPFFYRPGVDAPRHPRLVERGQRPFRSPGLEAPWLAVAGNHDLLTAGVVAPSERIAAAATGARGIVELDRDLEVPRSSESISPELVDDLLGEGLGRTARVPPDSDRRPLSAEEMLARLRGASAADGSGPRLNYAIDIGSRVRGVVLDTARRDAGSGGVVGPQGLAFLRRELRRAGDRHLVVFSHHPLRSAEGGEAALALLEGDPRVIAAISGHAHRNRIIARRTIPGARGLWLVETASLADFPQQARAFRLREAPGRSVALETWMVDHTGGRLAGISRELSHLDAQGGRPAGSRGARRDRNVRLHLPAPSAAASAPGRR